jgi:sigma-B regulation protein RsbQ
MSTIELDNINIDYTLSGKGEVTLLFIHGAFINKEYWNSQLDYFHSDYRVVSVDLAGHGNSGKNRNDWSLQALAEDVISVIKKLYLSNIILIGHSFGGDIILEVAHQIPSLILGFIGIDNFKSAGTLMSDEIQSQMDQAIHFLKRDFPNTVEVFVRQALITDATDSLISQRIIKDCREFDPQVGVPMLASSFSYYNRERELLEQLKLNYISSTLIIFRQMKICLRNLHILDMKYSGSRVVVIIL